MASKRPVNSSNSVTGFERTWATVTCGGGWEAALVAASLRAQAVRVAETTARIERVKAVRLETECMEDSLRSIRICWGCAGAHINGGPRRVEIVVFGNGV